MLTWFRNQAGARVAAAALVTVVTAAVIGGALVFTTTLACGPAGKAGLQLRQCARPVAARGSPTPFQFPSPSPTAKNDSASPSPQQASPSSAPSTGPTPPTGNGPASGAYPPFEPPSTGSNGLALPGVALSCRLPVYAGPPGSGGFIVFPGGNFIADPTSGVALPAIPTGSPSPQPPALGPGPSFAGFAYDAPFSTWLPVPHTSMSPDGAHYAFTSTSSIYVVDVRTKALTEVGKGHSWTIVGMADDAVLAEVSNSGGLWKLAFNGAQNELTSIGFWQAATPTAAYGTATSAVPNGVSNSIIRLDLGTGSVNDHFFTRDQSSSTVIGLDGSGSAVIAVTYFGAYQGTTEIWVVNAAGATPILGTSQTNTYLQGAIIGDAHGIWMSIQVSLGYYGGQSGVALYVPGANVYWMSNYQVQLAGGCS